MRPLLRSGVLILLVGVCSDASAVPSSDIKETRRKYEEMISEYESSKQELEAHMLELKGLQEEYRKSGVTAGIIQRRNVIRGKVAGPEGRLYALKKRLYDFKQIGVFHNTVILGVQGFQGAGLPVEAKEAIALPYEVLEKNREVRSFLHGYGQAKMREEGAFSDAVAQIQRRKARVRGIYGLSGIVVLVLFGVVRKMRAAPAVPASSAEPEGIPVSQALLGGNFRLCREVGRGGMGIVYEARDESLARKVAIKKMKKEVLENRRELDMFLEEARLVALLKHPNIVEIHSVVRESGQLYLVFEYVEGRPLHRLIEDETRLSLKHALSLMRPLTEGLDYAHSKKVIHRDLKPANIMVGAEGTVKIMDFGLAHQAKKTIAKLTQAVAWGTPPYMAPEQELGKVSSESDIFSLGACFYEMLTGEPAFVGADFLKQKRESDYVPATLLRPELPPVVDAVIRTALAPKPEDRFRSGSELFSALLHLE